MVQVRWAQASTWKACAEFTVYCWHLLLKAINNLLKTEWCHTGIPWLSKINKRGLWKCQLMIRYTGDRLRCFRSRRVRHLVRWWNVTLKSCSVLLGDCSNGPAALSGPGSPSPVCVYIPEKGHHRKGPSAPTYNYNLNEWCSYFAFLALTKQIRGTHFVENIVCTDWDEIIRKYEFKILRPYKIIDKGSME